MAKRYWIAKWSMGYAETNSEEPIDLCDTYTEEELEEMSDVDAESEVAKIAWDYAIEQIDSYAEPDNEKNE